MLACRQLSNLPSAHPDPEITQHPPSQSLSWAWCRARCQPGVGGPKLADHELGSRAGPTDPQISVLPSQTCLLEGSLPEQAGPVVQQFTCGPSHQGTRPRSPVLTTGSPISCNGSSCASRTVPALLLE